MASSVVRRRAHESLLWLSAKRPTNPARALIVAGHGRSGTTWIAEVLRDALRATVVFEPLNGAMVEAAARAGFEVYPCAQRELSARQLAHVEAAARGKLLDRWTISRTSARVAATRRELVLKTIRANSFLSATVGRLGTRPALVVVRDPVETVRSRLAASWPPRPEVMLTSDVLDVLPHAAAIVHECGHEAERHAAEWALDHALLFSDPVKRWMLVEYGQLRSAPAERFEEICARWRVTPIRPIAPLATRTSSTTRLGAPDSTPREVGTLDRRQILDVVDALIGPWYDAEGGFNVDRARQAGFQLV